MMEKIKAIVPARSGSKRLKNKNMRLLNGRPLLYYTLDALLGHKDIVEIIFTSDSQDYIKSVNLEYGSKVRTEIRPKKYANDTTKVKDEIERLIKVGIIDTEWFMLCLPTAPLRNFKIVNEVINAWKNDKIPRFTACKYEFPTQFAFEIDLNGDWKSCDTRSPMITGNTRSQDIPDLYRPNGAVYLQRTDTLVANKTFYINARPILMTNESSIDIDNELDFKIAEIILQKGKENFSTNS